MLEDLLQRRPYNAVTDLIDAPVERGLGGKTAFIDADRTLTYGDLQARSCQFASALLDIGLRGEERLALLLYDTVDFPMAFWGSVRAGIVALPLNTLLNTEQYAYILADSRASAIVALASLAKTLQPILDRLPRLRTIILVGGSADDRAAFAFMVAKMYAQAGDLDNSLVYLRKAMEDGYKNINQVYKDNEFATLRTDPRFTELMAQQPKAIQ